MRIVTALMREVLIHDLAEGGAGEVFVSQFTRLGSDGLAARTCVTVRSLPL